MKRLYRKKPQLRWNKQFDISLLTKHEKAAERWSIWMLCRVALRIQMVKQRINSEDFFFTSCGSLIPFTRANAQWVIHGHGFNKHYNLHFRVNSLFHRKVKQIAKSMTAKSITAKRFKLTSSTAYLTTTKRRKFGHPATRNSMEWYNSR